MESLTVRLDDSVSKEKIDSRTVNKLYKLLRKGLPAEYRKYDIVVISDGRTLQDIASESRSVKPVTTSWGSTDYKGQPWVQNVSRQLTASKGLYDRHISIWSSHGRYYDSSKRAMEVAAPRISSERLRTYTPRQ